MSRFFIKQISVTGEKVLFSEVSFNDGVNIIYGPSNAGKSYIINCINFMFAGDPPFTKSSTGYDTVTMTMESDDGYAISMTRKIIDGKNGEVGENSVEVISNYPNVESGPYSIMANVLALYQKITEEENLIDFSSIQTEAYSLMLNHPGILAEIREKIKYVMVDEYQDTNYIQELIVFLIAGESENICVVGDDDQGLYRFRGATIRNILEFPDHFIDGKCKRVDLTINYRSEKEIIDFYNDWMTSTDEKFVWKNFRFPKKIVPGKKDYSSDTRVVKCSGKNGVEDWYDSVYDFVISLKHQGVIKD